MARIRTIKPEFWSSPGVETISPWARLLYIAMWNWADDAGRGTCNLRELQAFAFPFDEAAEDVGSSDGFRRTLAEVRGRFGVVFYRVDGRCYYAIPTWRKHQRNERSAQSRHPAPEEGEPWDFMPPDQGSSGSSDNLRHRVTEAPSSASEAPKSSGPGTGEQGNRGTGEKNVTSEIATRPSDTATDRPEIDRICNHLADRIAANGSKRPTITKKWRDAARLMLDRDGIPEDHIHGAIDWCQNSDFWRANVMSLPKLREKYDTLRLQAKRPNGSAPTLRAVPSEATGTQRARQALEAGHELQAMIDRGEISL
jgi:hypothetical protein